MKRDLFVPLMIATFLRHLLYFPKRFLLVRQHQQSLSFILHKVAIIAYIRTMALIINSIFRYGSIKDLGESLTHSYLLVMYFSARFFINNRCPILWLKKMLIVGFYPHSEAIGLIHASSIP